MVSIEDIPVEERWIIAAKSAGFMPLLYDKFFRKALGEKYDDIERPLFMEAGKEMKDIAMALGLPSGNARQIVETVGILSTISFGSENKYEPVVETENGAMVKMTECAIRNSAIQMGLDHTLKQDTKNMCSGDKYCEIVVERQR